MTENKISIMTIKMKANSLMKNGKYEEAIMEYSEGILLQPANPLLYSNRSLAFLKLSQYFYALKDAETTIRLVPDWARGYYRKSQAEIGSRMFESAIETLETGLKMCPGDAILMKALDRANLIDRQYSECRRKSLRNHVMMGATIGMVLVIADLMLVPNGLFLRAAWIRWIFIFTLSSLFYLFRSVFLSMDLAKKNSLLKPPPDFKDSEKDATLNDRKSDGSFDTLTRSQTSAIQAN